MMQPEVAGAVQSRSPGRSSPRLRLAAVLGAVDARYRERLALKDLAEVAGLSVCRFVTVFRREVGMSPHRYVCGVRVRAAQDLLLAGVPAAIAATEVGFFDQSHLCRHFRAVSGMTPGAFIAQAASMGSAQPCQ